MVDKRKYNINKIISNHSNLVKKYGEIKAQSIFYSKLFVFKAKGRYPKVFNNPREEECIKLLEYIINFEKREHLEVEKIEKEIFKLKNLINNIEVFHDYNSKII